MQSWQWQVGAVALFVAWMDLLLFIRKIPRFGIYIVMFTDILQTFLQFSLVFFLFVVAFALAFFMLMQNQVSYDFALAFFMLMQNQVSYDFALAFFMLMQNQVSYNFALAFFMLMQTQVSHNFAHAFFMIIQPTRVLNRVRNISNVRRILRTRQPCLTQEEDAR